jgi:pseudouridine synthase
MHPRYAVDKEYLVKFKGRLTAEDLARAIRGIEIEGERYQVRNISLVRDTEHNGWYRVIVNEGKNRMIRKIGDALRHPVLKLRRIRIGPVTLRDMTPGHYRHLTPRELSALIGHAPETDKPPKMGQP